MGAAEAEVGGHQGGPRLGVTKGGPHHLVCLLYLEQRTSDFCSLQFGTVLRACGPDDRLIVSQSLPASVVEISDVLECLDNVLRRTTQQSVINACIF